MTLKEIIKRANLKDADLIAVYRYGSRVYGNFRKNSDHDFIIITKAKTTEQFSDRLININFFSEKEHQRRLDDHEISALEAYFAPNKAILLERKKFNFSLDKTKLRHSLSGKSSNSFVKAKKKLTVQKDYDLELGKKSLWHSFRIIDFGIQICKHEKIINFESCNGLFNEIMQYWTWGELFNEYKKKHNNKMSDFRKYAPKN